MAVMTSPAFDKIPLDTKATSLPATDAMAVDSDLNGTSQKYDALFDDPLDSKLQPVATDPEPHPTMNGNHIADGATASSDLAAAPTADAPTGIAPVPQLLPEQHNDSNSLFGNPEVGASSVPNAVEAPTSDVREETETIPSAKDLDAVAPAQSLKSVEQAENNKEEVSTQEQPESEAMDIDTSQHVLNATAEDVGDLNTTNDTGAEATELPDRSAADVAQPSNDAPTGLSVQTQPTSTFSTQIPFSQSPTAADQEMSEAPPSGKVRPREDDGSEDVPEAKRTKTDEIDQDFKVPVAPSQASQPLGNGTATATPAAPGTENSAIQSAVSAEEWPTTPMTKAQNKFLLERVRNTKKIKVAYSFKEPVNYIALNIPQYPEFIKIPMDLSTMETKLKDEKYSSVREFMKDLDLIVDNSVAFNGKDHPVTQAGYNMRAYFLKGMGKMPKAGVEEPVKPKVKKPPAVATSQKPRRESRASVPNAVSPVAPPPTATSPQSTFPLNADGIPHIRRDSSTTNDRPKREIHRPPPKDLPYSTAKPKKKQYQLELKFCESVLTEMMKPKYQKFSYPFLKPVDPIALNIPTYLKIIKKPMDLGTIEKNLREGQYQNAKEFYNDMQLMFSNCYKFNPENDEVHKMGKQLNELFSQCWSEKADWLADNAPTPEAQSPESDGSGDEEEEETDERDSKLHELQRQIEQLSQAANALMQNKSKRASPKASAKKGAKAAKPPKAKKPSLVPPPKVSTKPKAKTKPAAPLSFAQKQEISDGISTLGDQDMRRAVQIIRNGCPHLADVNDDEMEIDMDEIGDDTLRELHKFIRSIKSKAPVDDDFEAPRPPQRTSTTASRPKKNKPMGKKEQEDKIRMIQERMQQFQGGASGESQSPPAHEDSSDDEDESASESEEE